MRRATTPALGSCAPPVALSRLASLARHLRRALAASLLLPALALAQSSWSPSSWFAQGGIADRTQNATVGLSWDLSPHWEAGSFDLSAYLEASVSEWHFHSASNGHQHSRLAQLGLIPTLRVRPDHGASPWFGEIGIGATFTSTLYRTNDKSFSTRFNFGDHLALGRNFGARRQHELALRYEHFSNADIRLPNPGEDFLELRYAYRFH